MDGNHGPDSQLYAADGDRVPSEGCVTGLGRQGHKLNVNA